MKSQQFIAVKFMVAACFPSWLKSLFSHPFNTPPRRVSSLGSSPPPQPWLRGARHAPDALPTRGVSVASGKTAGAISQEGNVGFSTGFN